MHVQVREIHVQLYSLRTCSGQSVCRWENRSKGRLTGNGDLDSGVTRSSLFVNEVSEWSRRRMWEKDSLVKTRRESSSSSKSWRNERKARVKGEGKVVKISLEKVVRKWRVPRFFHVSFKHVYLFPARFACFKESRSRCRSFSWLSWFSHSLTSVRVWASWSGILLLLLLLLSCCSCFFVRVFCRNLRRCPVILDMTVCSPFLIEFRRKKAISVWSVLSFAFRRPFYLNTSFVCLKLWLEHKFCSDDFCDALSSFHFLSRQTLRVCTKGSL